MSNSLQAKAVLRSLPRTPSDTQQNLSRTAHPDDDNPIDRRWITARNIKPTL
jgi:hypothetical protein